MNNERQNADGRGEYDKKFGFVSPNATRASGRSAVHRYLAAERKGDNVASAAGRLVEEEFCETDFRARWWPAPDALH